MARFLVLAPREIGSRRLVEELLKKIREDHHEAELGTPSQFHAESRKVDGCIFLLDGTAPELYVALGYASAARLPSLVLSSKAIPEAGTFATLCVASESLAEWQAGVTKFYDLAQPFSGKLVRDLIPQLVREAGHELKFRALSDEEKPLHLKKKIVDEAMELESSDYAGEIEEVADVLEALEAFIRARGLERDRLRQVKEGKQKRRGGFERCYVVESKS